MRRRRRKLAKADHPRRGAIGNVNERRDPSAAAAKEARGTIMNGQ